MGICWIPLTFSTTPQDISVGGIWSEGYTNYINIMQLTFDVRYNPDAEEDTNFTAFTMLDIADVTGGGRDETLTNLVAYIIFRASIPGDQKNGFSR